MLHLSPSAGQLSWRMATLTQRTENIFLCVTQRLLVLTLTMQPHNWNLNILTLMHKYPCGLMKKNYSFWIYL